MPFYVEQIVADMRRATLGQRRVPDTLVVDRDLFSLAPVVLFERMSSDVLRRRKAACLPSTSSGWPFMTNILMSPFLASGFHIPRDERVRSDRLGEMLEVRL